MIKWLFIGLFFSISLSLLFIKFVGIQPRAQKVIDPSHYQNLQHIGYSIYQRLNQDINNSSVLILGSTNQITDSQNVWIGLFMALEKYSSVPKILINYNTSCSIKENPNFIEIKNINNEAELIAVIKTLISKRIKVIVNTTDYYSSYFDENSLTKKLIKLIKLRPLSITQGLFAVKKNQFKSWQKCKKNDSLSAMVCKAMEASQKYFRKKYSPMELRAAMEKHGANDYLLFIYQPNNF
ncbi:MAG: hypothetical protein H6625_05810 [Bdellovibrionaceae bacterium]|nr:hypothetical protein [Pseudobdellovibrionaceae bacterium]